MTREQLMSRRVVALVVAALVSVPMATALAEHKGDEDNGGGRDGPKKSTTTTTSSTSTTTTSTTSTSTTSTSTTSTTSTTAPPGDSTDVGVVLTAEPVSDDTVLIANALACILLYLPEYYVEYVTGQEVPNPICGPLRIPPEHTLAVTNHGSATADDVVVVEEVTNGVDATPVYAWAESTKGSCEGGGSLTITCTLGRLEPGEVVTVSVWIDACGAIHPGFPGATTVRGDATVSTSSADDNNANDRSEGTTVLTTWGCVTTA